MGNRMVRIRQGQPKIVITKIMRLDQLARDDLRSPVAAFSAARLISEA